MKKPRILTISTGGTWMMRVRKAGSDGKPVKVAELLGERFDFVRTFPAVSEFCNHTFLELGATDSSNLTPRDWSTQAEVLRQLWHRYDAFVLLQGTDTLAYTAPALSFALRNADKPVAITGAQLELDAPGSDADSNVVNAHQVVSLYHGSQPAIQGVVVVFGSRIIIGTRCRKYSERDMDAFRSINEPDLGRFRLNIQLDISAKALRNHRCRVHNSGFHVASKFNEHVALLNVYPGMKPGLLVDVGERSSAVILAGYGAGDIPCSTLTRKNELSLERAISQLVARGIPVGITTQCVVGQAEMGMYETGTAAQKAGAIILNDMTPETAYVKMSWLLANQEEWPKEAQRAMRGGPGRMAAIRKAMVTDMAGEITENRSLYGLYGLF